jgi:hypothetical protein
MRKEKLPLCVGGDFNASERFDETWSCFFNAIIDGLDLRELEISGRKFTWANALQKSTYEKLDRVLVSTEWDKRFPWPQ